MSEGAIIFFAITLFVLLLMIITMGFVIWGLSKDCDELENLVETIENKIKNLEQIEASMIFEAKE